MHKQLVLTAIFLGLIGCDMPEPSVAQHKDQAAVPAAVPKQDGQYLRFVQLESGETRLEAYQINGGHVKMTSGYPGFAVTPGTFPLPAPLIVRIKDCGTITFAKGLASPQDQIMAVRTDNKGFFSDKCPISNLDGAWTPLSIGQ